MDLDGQGKTGHRACAEVRAAKLANDLSAASEPADEARCATMIGATPCPVVAATI
jgi:hypothetical protein